jgi:uncharacterized protein
LGARPLERAGAGEGGADRSADVSIEPGRWRPVAEGTVLDVESLKRLLGLKPHPSEGGFFVETYRSAEALPAGTWPDRAGPHALATAIYFLVTPEGPSALHRLPTDEVFHFYLGDPVEMLQLRPDGSTQVLVLGTDLEKGMRPQVVVPRGTWQGSLLRPGGRYALLGTTMAPGFDPSDYEDGDPIALVEAYAERRERILALTPRERQRR